jgi:hypothetical protein
MSYVYDYVFNEILTSVNLDSDDCSVLYRTNISKQIIVYHLFVTTNPKTSDKNS